MAEQIKIRGSAEVPMRIVDRKIKKTLLQDDIEESRRYLDENLGRLAALSTIIEGNGKPLGVTANQDVAARALDSHLLEEIGRSPNRVGQDLNAGLTSFGSEDGNHPRKGPYAPSKRPGSLSCRYHDSLQWRESRGNEEENRQRLHRLALPGPNRYRIDSWK